MKKTIAGVLILGATATGGTLAADRAIDPYIDKATHYELALKSDIPQGERVEIHKDKAQMDLIGWNDEYKISIIPQIPTTQLGAKDKPFVVEANRPLLSKRMEYKSGDVTAFIEPKEGTENEFDIDFTLDSKPDTNVFEYKIEGAEEFDFFYQPELTPEEIIEGVERPENVVGSYAVYHKTKANHRIGSTNYATGKVFHIYRPKAIDANGAEVWAELQYLDGVLSITVPQTFLDEAAYPVIIDPTFGDTTCGASAQDIEDRIRGSVYTPTEDATGTSMSACLDTGSGATVFKTNVYGNPSVDTTPNPITNGATTETALTASVGNTYFTANFPSSPSFTSGTGYLLVVWTNTHTGNTNVNYDLSAGTTNWSDLATYGTWPDPLVESQGSDAINSIYATYTASGGGSPTPITPKVQIQAPIIINAPTILQ